MSFGINDTPSKNIDCLSEILYSSIKKEEEKVSFLVVVKHEDEAYIASDSYNTREDRNGNYIDTYVNYPKLFTTENGILGNYGSTTIKVNGNLVEIKDYIELPKSKDELKTLCYELQQYLLSDRYIGFVYLAVVEGILKFYHFFVCENRIVEEELTKKEESMPFGFLDYIKDFSKIDVKDIYGNEEEFLKKTIKAVADCEKQVNKHPQVGGLIQMYKIKKSGEIIDYSEKGRCPDII